MTEQLSSDYDVVVIDAGAPRDAPAAGVHGLLAFDGTCSAELVTAETDRAVIARRSPFSPESEARNCELVLGKHRHGV